MNEELEKYKFKTTRYGFIITLITLLSVVYVLSQLQLKDHSILHYVFDYYF